MHLRTARDARNARETAPIHPPLPFIVYTLPSIDTLLTSRAFLSLLIDATFFSFSLSSASLSPSLRSSLASPYMSVPRAHSFLHSTCSFTHGAVLLLLVHGRRRDAFVSERQQKGMKEKSKPEARYCRSSDINWKYEHLQQLAI